MPLCLLLTALVAPVTPLERIAAKNVAAFRKAAMGRDVSWFERTYAPTFTQTVDGQRIDRKTALAQLEHGLLRTNLTSLKGKLLRVKPKGTGYLATVAFTGTMRADISGMPSTLTAKWKDDQTWARGKGGWVLTSLATRGFSREIAPDRA